MQQLIKPTLWISAVLLSAGLAYSQVSAQRGNEQPEEPTVRICHRTNSVTNPYEKKDVPYSAIDGEGNNDHSQHQGPVPLNEAEAQGFKDSKTKWGDLIPPVDGVTPGLNWSTDGQAIWNNDCKYVPGTVDETPGEDPVDPETPDVPPITTAPRDPQVDSTEFSGPKGK